MPAPQVGGGYIGASQPSAASFGSPPGKLTGYGSIGEHDAPFRVPPKPMGSWSEVPPPPPGLSPAAHPYAMSPSHAAGQGGHPGGGFGSFVGATAALPVSMSGSYHLQGPNTPPRPPPPPPSSHYAGQMGSPVVHSQVPRTLIASLKETALQKLSLLANLLSVRQDEIGRWAASLAPTASALDLLLGEPYPCALAPALAEAREEARTDSCWGS